MNTRRFFVYVIIGFALMAIWAPTIRGADFKTDFESADIKDWEGFDEKDLGDKGPSNWSIGAGQIKGKALTQSSNIWGDASDTVPIGTVIVYSKGEWVDFVLEVDAFANDNDGMGVVWRFKDLAVHYRFFTMIDSGNPPNGERGPWRKLESRLGKGAGRGSPRAVRRGVAWRIWGRAGGGERARPPLLPSPIHRARGAIRRRQPRGADGAGRSGHGSSALCDAAAPAPAGDRALGLAPRDGVAEAGPGGAILKRACMGNQRRDP